MKETRGLVDQLVGACLALMVAAIALSVTVSIIRPYLTLLVLGAGVVAVASAWRAWQRSRW